MRQRGGGHVVNCVRSLSELVVASTVLNISTISKGHPGEISVPKKIPIWKDMIVIFSRQNEVSFSV